MALDELNNKALRVLETKGSNAFVKHVFTCPKDQRQLSYAEMRMLYG